MSLSLMGLLIGPGIVTRGLLVHGTEIEDEQQLPLPPTRVRPLVPGPDMRVLRNKQPVVRLRTKKRS